MFFYNFIVNPDWSGCLYNINLTKWVKVKGEWKITLDSIYKLIENQEKIFLGAVAIAIFNFMKLSYL